MTPLAPYPQRTQHQDADRSRATNLAGLAQTRSTVRGAAINRRDQFALEQGAEAGRTRRKARWSSRHPNVACALFGFGFVSVLVLAGVLLIKVGPNVNSYSADE